MPVRYPPESRTPPAPRGPRATARPGRIAHYEEPPVGFPRRVARRVFTAPVVIPLAVVIALVFGVFVYYWTIFSGRIDNLLKGEVFTRSAGIYAAPKQLRAGENLSTDDLIAYLKRAGYVEKTQQADQARGRYSIADGSVDIEPSRDSTVDGQRQFPHLHVQFSRNGKSISSIVRPEGNARVETAFLEPELISSVTGHDRAKRRVVGFNRSEER